MIQAARLSSILATLEDRGTCSIAALAQQLGVSEETIRRDVRKLEGGGRVTKVHGGVRLPDSRLEAPFRTRLRDNADGKQAIARLAARQIVEDMVVLIDSGTTSFWVARELAHVRRLTIVTNSLEVAGEVVGRGEQRLFLAGGAVNRDYRAAFDADAIAFSRRFVFDVAVMSIGAIDAVRGFLDFEPEEAAYKCALLDRCRRVMMVSDHRKFARAGTVHVADFADVDDLVLDLPPPPEVLAVARREGVRIAAVSDDAVDRGGDRRGDRGIGAGTTPPIPASSPRGSAPSPSRHGGRN